MFFTGPCTLAQNQQIVKQDSCVTFYATKIISCLVFAAAWKWTGEFYHFPPIISQALKNTKMCMAETKFLRRHLGERSPHQMHPYYLQLFRKPGWAIIRQSQWQVVNVT